MTEEAKCPEVGVGRKRGRLSSGDVEEAKGSVAGDPSLATEYLMCV